MFGMQISHLLFELLWRVVFGPQKCRKLFLSKIEIPPVLEIAKMVIAKFVFKAIL